MKEISRIKKIGLLLGLYFSLTSSMSWALGFGVEGGFKQQSGDTLEGYSTASQVGYQFGAVGFLDFSEKLAFRSGLMYSQRPLKITNDSTQESTTLALTYFDVPLSLVVKFEDYMGVYLGTALAIQLDKSSSKKSVFDIVDAKSMVFPLQFGITFKFMPDVGMNLYFEQFGDVAKDLKSYRSVGLNLLFTVE
mgnify:CR=1 FL=1